MRQALAFVWNHAYHHGILEGVKRSGNLVVVITNELLCGRKMELGVCILNVIGKSGGNLAAVSVTTCFCCGRK